VLPVHFDDLPLAVVRDGENVVREQVVADLAVAFFEGTLLLANETPHRQVVCAFRSQQPLTARSRSKRSTATSVLWEGSNRR
jgi:hypothetical protein